MSLTTPPTAVIFDLDGTLADTLADIAASMNRVLAELGLPEHPPSRYCDYIGEGARELVLRALPPARRGELADAAYRRFRVHYADHLLDQTALYAGVPPVLDALAARGTPMAVLSNKPHALTERVAAALLVPWRFEAVLGHRPEAPRKPDPSVALDIARALATAPAACAFVGDTAVDMETAARAGMVAIGAGWGFRGAAELLAHGARAVIDRPLALLDLLK